jgi:cytochrome c oxidase subunit 3
VFATAVFIATEVMFFLGLISAHAITVASAPTWPPPGQPRLPIEATAVNTLALLVSGAVAHLAGRRFAADPATARRPLDLAIFLGAFFVVFQGWEWAGLVREGLTLSSSTHGGFFYVIVGTHALHALAGLAVLAWTRWTLRRGTLTGEGFAASRLFWSFVVVLWPVLYWRVYL